MKTLTMYDAYNEYNEQQISCVLIHDKKVLDCTLLLDSYFKTWVNHRQLSDWLKIKGIALITGQKVNTGYSPAVSSFFPRNYGEWCNVDSILRYRTYHNSRVIHTNNLQKIKEMRHMGKNESIYSEIETGRKKMRCHWPFTVSNHTLYSLTMTMHKSSVVFYWWKHWPLSEIREAYANLTHELKTAVVFLGNWKSLSSELKGSFF